MTVQFSFQARLSLDNQVIPVATEITAGAANAGDGVKNGFLFTLDYEPGDAPVTISLGGIIGFIQDKLGGGDLSTNPGLALLEQAFSGIITAATFTPSSTLVIAVRSFTINSTTDDSLFSISIDVGGSDPTTGLIPLPSEFAGWLQIQNLAIAFTAERKA